ncbi:glycosyltransferase [Herbaspirillum rhizosphaerae]|uniref:glycosyltransferase n=1 Tax=Herbaspirillum rhizosphaerae TaxID=346179 RepID=UPI00067B3D9E|nr:glycosyltransferase [Herbaspirillum rhizosphaerae]
MKIVCWHPVLTDHQSYTWEALQQAGVSDLQIFTLEKEHAERQAQGWVNRHAAAMPSALIPQTGWFGFALRQLRERRDAVHLFGSPFERPRLMLVLLAALCMRRRVWLISEPYSPISTGYQSDNLPLAGRIKAALRPLVYKIYGALLKRRINGILAISPLAVSQYAGIGIAPEKIYPFAYFVPRLPDVPAPTADLNASPLRLIFIGTLIARKGIDVLLDAIAALRQAGVTVHLDIYGPGDGGRFDEQDACVRYRGTIPFGEAQRVIAGYDFLVLPSRYDGWGVVVNEALLAGVPVIGSDAAGASAVVRKWRCGRVFANGDAGALAGILRDLSADGTDRTVLKEAARCAGDALDPHVAGRYLFAILAGDGKGSAPQSECPWYDI